jgi:prenyltransferase beta subunit
MKPCKTGSLICLAVCFNIVVFSTTGSATAGEAKKIDFSKTWEYVNNWAARDAFPDSPSFAYMNVYCQRALGHQAGDAAKQKIVRYLKKCQKPDGGFVANPDQKGGTEERSNVIFTYFALATLDLIDNHSSTDMKKATDFVISLVQKDGGIGLNANGSANLGTTYYGVRCLSLLNALDRIDKNRTIKYIISHRDDNKGFGVLPGKPSAPQSTFMAVESLKLLGGLTEDIKTGVMKYLVETPFAWFRKPENLALLELDDQSSVLETAAICQAMSRLNTEKIHEFVASQYIAENGGFGPSAGLGSTPPATYYAIECLVKLGVLKDPYAGR